jgi:hypothetical protein
VTKERKWEKLKNTVRTKITEKSAESRRTSGGFGPPFPLQHTTKILQKFQFMNP